MGRASFLPIWPKSASVNPVRVFIVLAVSCVLTVAGGRDGVASEEQEVIDLARITLQALLPRPDFQPFRAILPRAKGLIIVPEMPKIGFIVGTGGATGVLLGQYPEKGQWSQPSFYHFALGNVSIQFVPEIWDIVLIVTTARGLDALLAGKVTLGRDLRFSTDPRKIGDAVEPADGEFPDVFVYAAAPDAGDFLPLDGANLWSVENWNEAYYGAPVSLTEILFGNEVDRGGSRPLRDVLSEAVE